MAKDYYALLGVSRNADAKEIKSAYRKLARKLHPDVNPNDKSAEAKFKEVSEAHDVLSDPEKRKLYDAYGANWEHAQNMTGGVPGQEGDFEVRFGGQPGSGFESIFEQFFGGNRAGRGGFSDLDFEAAQVAQPRDIEKVIEIPLEEIDTGSKRTLTYQTLDAQRTRGGISTVPTTKKVEIKIPAGIADGKKLRVPGKGHAGVNGKAGDLYVAIRWTPHPKFRSAGESLEVEVSVPYTTAALGGSIKVPTLRGTVSMKVPEGTQSGQTFRLAGQGISRLNRGKGDLMARVKITVPKRPTEDERKLLKELAALQGTSE